MINPFDRFKSLVWIICGVLLIVLVYVQVWVPYRKYVETCEVLLDLQRKLSSRVVGVDQARLWAKKLGGVVEEFPDKLQIQGEISPDQLRIFDETCDQLGRNYPLKIIEIKYELNATGGRYGLSFSK